MSSVSRTRSIAVAVTLVLGAALASATAPASAAAPKDTGLLTFVRSNQIYTSTAAGTGVKKLTTSAKNYRPHWSPDGKRIAFVHETAGNVRDIWVMNANGSGKLRVTHLGDTSEPTWSPDGKWLAFGADGTPPYSSSGGQKLQKIKSTAPFGSPTVLTGNGDPQYEPLVEGTLDWSPDGTKIVYVSDSFPSSPDHYVLVYTIATKKVDMLAEIGGSCCGEGFLTDPAWTKDSAAVALSYLAYDPWDPKPTGPHLAIIDFPDQTSGTYPNVVGDRDPDYSPTGSKLAFSHWSRIYTSDADGTHRKDVTSGYHPDWQPAFG